jgi:hypothetical protein
MLGSGRPVCQFTDASLKFGRKSGLTSLQIVSAFVLVVSA